MLVTAESTEVLTRSVNRAYNDISYFLEDEEVTETAPKPDVVPTKETNKSKMEVPVKKEQPTPQP